MRPLTPKFKFGFAILAAVALGWRPLSDTFALALRRDEYTHILLILPITAALLYTEWPPAESKYHAAPGWGPAMLVLALLLGLTARFALQGDWQMFLGVTAVVLWCLGSFVLCFGDATFRVLLFPLCFLFCLVPIPKVALDSITVFWQQGSAVAANLLFSAAGVPVSHNGVFLSIPGLTLEIAQECSSLRSSLMLVVTSMVLAHLFLRSSWRKLFLVLAAIPISIAKNGVRVFTISMLGTRVDSGFLHGRLHHDGGIVFFLMGMFAVLLLLWFLGRRERGPAHRRGQLREPTVRLQRE
jgi:exosortase